MNELKMNDYGLMPLSNVEIVNIDGGDCGYYSRDPTGQGFANVLENCYNFGRGLWAGLTGK